MKTSVERLGWAQKVCRKIQMRITPVRSSILAYLSEQRTPVGLANVCDACARKYRCDETTVYRTLMLFRDAGLVRVVGTAGKRTQYVLNVPGDEGNFLICDGCGAVVELEVPPATQETIRKLAMHTDSPAATNISRSRGCANSAPVL